MVDHPSDPDDSEEQWHPHIRGVFPLEVPVARWRGTLETEESHPLIQLCHAANAKAWQLRYTRAMRFLHGLSERCPEGTVVFTILDEVHTLLDRFLQELPGDLPLDEAERTKRLLARPLIRHVSHVVVEALPEQVYRDALQLYEPAMPSAWDRGGDPGVLKDLAEHHREFTAGMPEQLPVSGPRSAGVGGRLRTEIEFAVKRLLLEPQ